MNDLQERILEIYKEVAELCDSFGIRHFAIGGTAIGAIRHGGFIPWDDDLDLAMPIEDYDRFLSIADGNLREGLRLVTEKGRPHYRNAFCKVEDSMTTCIERSVVGFRDSYTGVWVDIMPMSGIPASLAGRMLFMHRCSAYGLGNLARRMPATALSGRSLLRKYVNAPLDKFRATDHYSEKWHEVLSGQPFDGSEYTGYTWSYPSKSWPIRVLRGAAAGTLPRRRGSYALEDLVFPSRWFAYYTEVPFEDTTMRLPSCWDEYLTAQFGDYMTPPSSQERLTHECFVDLHNPVEDYASGLRRIPEDYWEADA